MNIKKMKLPVIIIAIGLILAVLSCLITGIIKEPIIKEHEFDYSVTYRLDGELKTYEGSFKCSFNGYEGYDDPTARLYQGVHKKDGQTLDSFFFTVAENGEVELDIVINLNAEYLMGDPDKYEYDSGNEEPYFEALRASDYSVEVSDFFDAEIISWDYPEPIENSFKFAGFSRLYAVSMLVMLLVGVLTIIACAIFVKRDRETAYNALDKLSVVANFVACILVIPFISICTALFPLTMSTDDILYQIFLCIPALIAFTVAASIALRRKGFTKTGFLVQFVGPVIFFVPVVIESIIVNFFG